MNHMLSSNSLVFGNSPGVRVWRLSLLVASAGALLSTSALAVSPPPGGSYPNQTTALGQNALFDLTSGTDNTALGFQALFNDTTGSRNVAVGTNAMLENTTGSNNVATGASALQSNTIGGNNTAHGYTALYLNTTGNGNSGFGTGALANNTTASSNTAAGFDALFVNTTGSSNTAVGSSTLGYNFNGNSNTAVGSLALGSNSSGSGNIAIGSSAGGDLVSGSNNIYIGNFGASGAESNKIRIGTMGTQKNAFIAGIFGVTVGSGVSVLVDSNGRLGTSTSSARFKDEIKPMDKASEAILSLKPVTFHYKSELDPAKTPQFGLVAEQVAKVDSNLVAKDEQGRPYTVRYEAVNAMLLNEFLKEHRKVEEQDQKALKLEAKVARLEQALERQAAALQKVSLQLATQHPAPQVAANE